MKLWTFEKGSINLCIEWKPPRLKIRAKAVREALEKAYPKGHFIVQEIITRDEDFTYDMPE